MTEELIFFKKQLEDFYTKILRPMGYTDLAKEEMKQNGFSRFRKYYSKGPCELYFVLSQIENGNFNTTFTMVLNEPGLFGKDQTFMLNMFYEENPSLDFPRTCHPGEDFNEFISNYFSKIEEASKTYLKEQLEGTSFKEHNFMKDFYDSMYEINRDIIAASVADTPQEKQSLMKRILKVIK